MTLKQYKHKRTNNTAIEQETNYKVYTINNIFVCNIAKRMVEENPDRYLIDNQNIQ
jgi:hypothetical protein